MMQDIPEFVDERQNGWCVNCGQGISELVVTRDHVPSKSLLRKPYPPILPVIPVCLTCNGGFSADEEYLAAFLGCVISGSTDVDRQDNPRVAAILKRSPALVARIERGRSESMTTPGHRRILWTPEQPRIHRVVLKNARGHAYFEYGEPMLDEPLDVRCSPLEALSPEARDSFDGIGEHACWPEVGSRMLTRLVTGQDLLHGWIIVQEGVYRYTVVQEDRLIVRSVLYDYLATEVCWMR
jgi:hypothetical protein